MSIVSEVKKKKIDALKKKKMFLSNRNHYNCKSENYVHTRAINLFAANVRILLVLYNK